MTANRPTGRPAAIRFSMGGHEFTCKQLADLAGCSPQTMHRRLARGMTAAAAVAWGPADRNRARPNAPASVTARPGKFVMSGQRYTCRALASMAGCSPIAMRSRLRTLSPEEALARGASDSNRPRKKPEERKTPERVKSGKASKPAPVPKTKPASSAALSAKSWAIKEKKAAPESLKVKAPSGPVVMLPGVKITRSAPIPDRFAVDPKTCPPIFSGRPYGQHEATGSALERAYA